MRESLSQALWFINQIRALYRIEDQARDLGATARHPLRQEQALAIWEALKTHAVDVRPSFLPKSTMGRPWGTSLISTRR